ncbi:hypothetical protein THAPSDRAFT_262646 [Thalassiosira pseudonana CCMP1335]|uniref:Uncharacterized protein n=1 Tax=Thalassiosira pseudonana TaxID=35128 RepID=B8C3U7_THAPS|nr:hypothetical protein THAPSDRAFT_262646 [Thalassiosira pseudonana CCMP1335]EED92186.1 hypothetical protein THAPSDRAFT_262646 [Thalassiosira pseudonana CCMP1335]
MSTVGVNGDLFYLGLDQKTNGRSLQSANATNSPELSLVYGLVNIAVFLAQSMTESIIYDTCDELNTQHIPGNATDGIGLDDGLDQFRFPISNACGSNGRSYQNEQCKKIEDLQYDCAKQMNSEEFRLMEARATTFARWRGAPGPLYCGPKSIHGETGFWDSTMGMEMGEVSLANDDGANKAARDGRETALFPDVDFCRDPGEICAGVESIKLRWISGMYAFMENVQKYNEDGFSYNVSIKFFITLTWCMWLSQLRLSYCLLYRVTVDDVMTVAQYPGVDFVADSNFDSQSDGGSGAIAVLQVLMNVTMSYSPPEPDGWRDWSIYLKSWIESFGVTVVEILTSPKHVQHPDTTSKFWDDLADVSATNVPPPRNATEIPTPPPTYIIYPEPDASDKAILGGAVGAAILGLCFFCGFAVYKYRKAKQYQAMRMMKMEAMEEAYYGQPQANFPVFAPWEDPDKESDISKSSSESGSSSDDSSEDSTSESDDTSESEEKSSDEEEEEEEEESVYTHDESAARESISKDQSTISTDDDWQAQAAVERLSLRNSNVDDTELSSLSLALVDNTAVTHLWLGDNNITSEGAEYLIGTLESNNTIVYVELEGNRGIDDDIVSSISLALVDNKSITHLNLANNAITTDGAESTLQSLEANDPSLVDLMLDDVDLVQSPEAEPILDALAANKHVTSLSLNNTCFDDSLIATLSLALVDNRSITHISLRDNKITSEGCEYLMGTLDSNTKIIHLDLTGNPTDLAQSPDAEPLVDALAGNSVVTSLSFNNTGFDDSLIAALSLALVDNESITHISLKGNNITSEGCEYLMGTLDSNTTLTKVELDGKGLSREDESALFEALANNKYVTSLSLRKNKIDNEGAGELCEALRRNSSLTHINLEENLITSNAALDFITCLKEHNDTVQYLELADNRVRSGLFSQMNKILEQRRPGYVEAAPVAAVDVAEAAKPKSKRASKKGREIV